MFEILRRGTVFRIFYWSSVREVLNPNTSTSKPFIVQTRQKGQIVIPRSVRETFLPGEKVAILAYNDRIELRPLGTLD
ncbi:AbrB/MazE/SpoVT family DNA-binding domain-containing protein [Methanogenium sp. S4BF]|uniref:AbrB/MazE/SpoVT family DNA-binding domain-containing protein n=1 Tax=Methanogenium sp. S4BF TaxID=1789226 RepID=UPI003241EF4E